MVFSVVSFLIGMLLGILHLSLRFLYRPAGWFGPAVLMIVGPAFFAATHAAGLALAVGGLRLGEGRRWAVAGIALNLCTMVFTTWRSVFAG